MIDTVKTAAAYIRVSTDDQTEYSPAAQLRELREYAADHRLLLDERYIYADEGISGRKAEKRPGFMKMISDARSKEHPFDVILVHKFDRFARSREDSVVYKAMLKRAGVEVVSIREPISEGNYAGVMEAIYESFAEAYSINLAQEVKKGMTEKALRGELQSTPSFGYRVENHMLVPHETEAPIIVEIFRRYTAGGNTFAIARWCNEQGYTTHRGSRFENRTIEYILRNPVYIGKLRWNPTGRTRRNYSNPGILTVDSKHTPLIDMDTWNQAQAQLDAQKALHRPHGRPSFDRKHWLCGIVRCAACGATLVWCKPHYLKCNNYVRGRCTHSQHIAAQALSEAVIAQLQHDMLTSSSVSCQALRPREENQLAPLRQTLSRIEKKSARLTDAYLNEAIGLAEYKALRESLAAERAAAEAALADAQSSTPAIDPIATLKLRLADVLKTLTDPNATTEQKYTAANQIISRCTFDKSTFTLSITYRLSF